MCARQEEARAGAGRGGRAGAQARAPGRAYPRPRASTGRLCVRDHGYGFPENGGAPRFAGRSDRTAVRLGTPGLFQEAPGLVKRNGGPVYISAGRSISRCDLAHIF